MAAFTIIELIVAFAIMTMLIALVLWGVQKVRAAAARTQCIQNMKQISLAVQAFHDRHDRMPVYNGIFPYSTATNDTSQGGNTYAVYGSYYVHLLPYLEQMPLYQSIRDDVLRVTNTGKATGSEPGTPRIPGVLVTPAVAGTSAVYDYTGLTYNPGVAATYNNYNTAYANWSATATKTEVITYTQSPQSKNGAVIWVANISYTYSPAAPSKTPDAGTGTSSGWFNASGQRVNPPLISAATSGTPAYYNPAEVPAGAAKNLYSSTFKREHRGKVISTLICPSDPSPGSDPNASSPGQVYANNADASPWATTNYLGNWNVLTTGNAAKGYKALPRNSDSIGDGLSNTVLLAEGYAWCDGVGRTALVAFHEKDPIQGVQNGGMTGVDGAHNFGLTYALNANKIQAGSRSAVTVTAPYGYPNPSGSPELIFEYQITPRPLSVAQCPQGVDCCNAMTVQTGHVAGLNVAMSDGSVRTLRAGLSLDTWRCLVLPNDGVPIQGDW